MLHISQEQKKDQKEAIAEALLLVVLRCSLYMLSALLCQMKRVRNPALKGVDSATRFQDATRQVSSGYL